jgi:sigma-E factor negative regulatory protein RseB
MLGLLVRRYIARVCVLLVLSSTAAGHAFAAESSVLEMLERMQTATQDMNYHGTLVYLQDGQVQSMRVVHKADKRGEFERLINLNGVAREIVRKDGVMICYMPDTKAVMVGQQHFSGNFLAQLAGNDFTQLQARYSFSFEGKARVAGQMAQAILIKPLDVYRYGYRLWVDTTNALLLKSDLLNEQGEILEQAMFADISIGEKIPDSMLAPETDSEGFTWFKHSEDSGRKAVVDSRWKIEPLPQGFAVTARFNHPMPNAQGDAEHWVVSDGLASISIYFEKMTENQPIFEGNSPIGATNAFGLLNNGFQITVIGEVPASTVKMLATALLYREGE